MRIEYDPNKSAKNARERHLPFDLATYFDWDNALYKEDRRKLYGERRYIALGYFEGRVHCICFTSITGGIRIISFRRASAKETLYYEEKKAADR